MREDQIEALRRPAAMMSGAAELDIAAGGRGQGRQQLGRGALRRCGIRSQVWCCIDQERTCLSQCDLKKSELLLRNRDREWQRSPSMLLCFSVGRSLDPALAVQIEPLLPHTKPGVFCPRKPADRHQPHWQGFPAGRGCRVRRPVRLFFLYQSQPLGQPAGLRPPPRLGAERTVGCWRPVAPTIRDFLADLEQGVLAAPKVSLSALVSRMCSGSAAGLAPVEHHVVELGQRMTDVHHQHQSDQGSRLPRWLPDASASAA